MARVRQRAVGKRTMIDLTRESVLSFAEAASRLPRRRNGKRPHRNTLLRWATEGLHGVPLETIRIGGTLCTSIEALQRFFNALSQASSIAPLRPGSSPSVAKHTEGKSSGGLSRVGAAEQTLQHPSGDERPQNDVVAGRQCEGGADRGD